MKIKKNFIKRVGEECLNNKTHGRVSDFFKKVLLPCIFGAAWLVLSSSCAEGMFADSLIHANRQPLVKNPADYGLAYDDISFKTADDLTIKGWFIPGTKDSIAVMVHPMNFSKYGYSVENQGRFKITDIEVEFLTTARELNKAGHNVLTFDLRNHGESDDSKDRIFGLGVFEYQDVIGALDYIAGRDDLKDKQIFFVAFCTGANSTIIAMNKEPEKFANVKCMAAIQPISTAVFVENFMNDKYKAFTGMIPSIEKKCVEKGGLPWSKMSPIEYLDRIILPTLYVQAEQDAWTDPDFVRMMYEKTPEPKELIMFTGDMHRFDTYNYFGHSPEKLLEFVDKYVVFPEE